MAERLLRPEDKKEAVNLKIRPDLYGGALILVFAAILIGIGTGEIVKMRQKPVKVEVITAETAAETSEKLTETEQNEIVGEVSADGVETVFIDLTEDTADIDTIIIDRSFHDDAGTSTENTVTTVQSTPAAKAKVNINTASKEELMSLDGIGEKTADAIMAYRDIAPFETVEEIMEVKGIGEKKYDAIKDDICI